MTPRQIENKKREEKKLHGVPGQLNGYVLDIESDITGYGKHNRLLVSGHPDGRQITVREDRRGLPNSEECDRQKVLHGWQRSHPKGKTLRLVCVERTIHNSWFYYDVV